MSKIVLGVDVGGTFTDFVAFDRETGAIDAWKNLSVPNDPITGVLTGLGKIEDKDSIIQIMHGTTIATNAILERKGVQVAYVTTKGFKDIPFIGRGNRRGHYDLTWVKASPLYLRRNSFEIDERLNYKGEVLKSIEDEEVINIAKAIKERPEIEALAVNLLFSYVNPAHEYRVKEIFEEYLPGMPVSLSFEVLPKWKEYERACTTICDAYIKPIVSKYVDRIVKEFEDKGIPKRIVIMKSNGGAMQIDMAKKTPIHTAVSGPTGGVVAAKTISNICNIDNIVTYDMGGTSTDVALVKDGKEQFTTDFEIVWGLPVQVPMIDIRTIGAGGGSIAWIDKGGMLNVGPQSAGADPGPACYGRGGKDPCVTDANVVLNRINPDYFLGGTMKLDKKAAYDSMEKLGKHLNMTAEEVASAIISIVNNNMVGALRNILVEDGNDPRDFSLLSFGGAGSLHSVDMADVAGIKEVVVPINPGQFSAMGFLFADARIDLQRTVQMTSRKFDAERAKSIIEDLFDSGMNTLKEQNFEENIIRRASIEMRYLGQNYELEVPVTLEEIEPNVIESLWKKFDKLHNERYGFMIPEEPLEIVNFNVTVTHIIDKPQMKKIEKSSGSENLTFDTKDVVFDGKYISTKVYKRDDLLSGDNIIGPALVEEAASVTVIKPGWQCSIDDYANMRIVRL